MGTFHHSSSQDDIQSYPLSQTWAWVYKRFHKIEASMFQLLERSVCVRD